MTIATDDPKLEMPARQRTQWFQEARFGLFMHYGLYSLAARHEWVRQREHLSKAQYRRYFDHFTADRFDARQWAATAVEAGMRYAVLTTKHHEGFCLWDSELTDFKATRTPARRDLVAEFTEACRAEGLRVGLYYSLLDWNHPDFPLDGYHPRWDPINPPRFDGDGDRYVEYLHGQVDELVGRFAPDVLWFDFSYPGDDVVARGKGAAFWRSAELMANIRRRLPNVLVNDRLDLAGDQDFTTPEEVQPQPGMLSGRWEACRTLNGSWGYAPELQNWLSAESVAMLLIDSVAQGGNLLLNVGPTGRGSIEPRARQLLAAVGEWAELHGDAIYGAGPAAVVPPSGCRMTQHGRRVFLHLTGGWIPGKLVLQGLPAPLRYASFLHDGAEVQFEIVRDRPRHPHMVLDGPIGSTALALPQSRPAVLVPVIELDLDWGGDH